jgi:hypothetical protein
MEYICTDPATEQYGRRISEKIYEFKETVKFPDGNSYVEEKEIDLNDYSEDEINDHLSPYGWNIIQLKEENTIEDAEWLMAECIFEQTIFE